MGTQLAKTDQAALTKITAGKVNEMLVKNKEVIERTLPKGFNFDRMCRTVINAISTTPLLAKCSPASLLLSSVRGFSLGLEPNGALQDGYLIPFWNSKKSFYEAQFMPSYRGLQNLARRSGQITELYAVTVCEKDEFEVTEGLTRNIVHKPNYRGGRGKAVCYYAVFKLLNGGTDFEVMNIEEIEKVRKSSKSADDGPWKDWPEEMAKKTVMKRLLKRAPMSIELSGAVEADNDVATGETQSTGILEIEGLDIEDAETPAEVQGEINRDRVAALREQIAQKKAAEKQDAPVEPADVKAKPDELPM